VKIQQGLSYDDVLLIPQRSDINSRSQVSLKTKLCEGVELDMPIISINMDSVTGVEMAISMSSLGGMSFMPRFDSAEDEAKMIAAIVKKKERVIAALGLRDDYLDRAEKCLKAGAVGLTIDVAHGHMSQVIKATSILKNKFGVPVFSGVVATKVGARDLFKAGADGVRVGVGPGTICLTRVVTGCGVPQLTAIMEASGAAKEFKNKIVIADGGIKNSGDIVKALAAGASCVVLGSLLAGTDESPGEKIFINGKVYKQYNASTSKFEKESQIKRNGNKRKHFKLHIEGVESLVPYRGPVEMVIKDLCAGIRSGFSYCGAKNISQLWKRAEFVQITSAGMRESGTHDVLVR
jgi:IMP dehydrogenase